MFYFSAKTWLLDCVTKTARTHKVNAFYFLVLFVQLYVKYSSIDVIVYPDLTLIKSKCILLEFYEARCRN